MTPPSPTPLPRPLRTQLENTVKSARVVAEQAALAALDQLAVGAARAPDDQNDDARAQRRRLRAHGRSLGDARHADDGQGMQHLVREVAYEHWHRMLFARVLAENHLLLWEPGAPVTLAECDELAQSPATSLGARSGWELAGRLAARMLPQVFRPRSPAFELALAPEHQRALEKLLAALPAEVFQASDSLGWVYQFWQAKRKDEVNASEVKIGADELPAVTQLFTEPYMVDFLLHNSLGAWWATRHPNRPCPVPLPYLRTLDDGMPAAGRFEGWPDTLEDFTLLDPCCGSGHFLVAAFLLLVPMRMEAEGLSALDAVDAVLEQNLHGLEIDPRCVEIAVFALALAAWRWPDEDGHPLGVRCDMPAPRIACCGLKVAARPQDWEALVPDDTPNAAFLRQELRLLHAAFAQAPLLGSLLDPARSIGNDLVTSSYETLQPLLDRALATETPSLWGGREGLDEDAWDLAVSAQGLLDAARLLDGRYHLVVTNVPYLARGKHSDELKRYCEKHYSAAKHDLATVFVERCHELCGEQGTFCLVSPQNWWFLKSYVHFRAWLLTESSLLLAAALGEEAWEYFGNRGPLATLLIASSKKSPRNMNFTALDVVVPKTLEEKRVVLRSGKMKRLVQSHQLRNPDARIMLSDVFGAKLLSEIGLYGKGSTTGDSPRFLLEFWQLHALTSTNIFWVDSPNVGEPWSGRSLVTSMKLDDERLRLQLGCRIHGQEVWKKAGVAVNKMRELEPFLYNGEVFDDNVCPIVPRQKAHLIAIWMFVSDPSYRLAIREVDKAIKVTAGTITKVPFDVAYWQKVAAERYPDGLPGPYSDDPTQWLFHGHPQPATDPLQVAVARLLGYSWLAESDTAMELSDEARQWIARCAALTPHAHDDGIVCLPSVRGEPPAHERLLALLIDAWETVTPGSWKAATLDKLLAEADCAGKSLEGWLREKFFEQHAKRFHHRPFVWHVWDGLKDGFGALVNYHKLDAKNLERLIHAYLGDWIDTQQAGVAAGIDGAAPRLAAAHVLKKKLEAILVGEDPHDIFVRWKPIEQQPTGWHPDLNDGVRLNIRPFMIADVLRHNRKPKLNITWDKDRGKDVESAPWFKVFKGERINDHHLTLAEKAAARAVSEGSS